VLPIAPSPSVAPAPFVNATSSPSPAVVASEPSAVVAATTQPRPRILLVSVRMSGTFNRAGAVIKVFTVRARRDAVVHIRCRGGGCPAGARTRSAKLFRLARFQRALPAGAVVEVFVTKPGMFGRYSRFKIRKALAPARQDMCTPPDGRLRPVRCPSAGSAET